MSDNLDESEGRPAESPQALAFWFVFSAFLGFLAVLLPPYLQSREVPPFWFFDAVAYAIEKQTYWTLVLLFGAGLLIGWRSPRYWPLKCCATMASFPIIAIVDMMLHPMSHNLWPFEFAIYAAETIPALAGGALAYSLAGMRRTPLNSDD